MNLIGTAKKFVPLAMRRRMLPVAKFAYRDDLCKLATFYGTDKWGGHWYMQHYQRYFEPLRKKPLNLLEIGVGGDKDPRTGGQSLRTWKRFFPKARIVGIDIFDKTHFSQPRIDVRICDQTDAMGLRKLSDEYGGFDIIIDDGSHVNEHVIKTFHTLFPLLRALWCRLARRIADDNAVEAFGMTLGEAERGCAAHGEPGEMRLVDVQGVK